MNDVYIFVDTETGKTECRNKKIGIQHANLQNKLIFNLSKKINGSAWLEYEINGVKNYAVMEEIDDGYQIVIKSCLLISDYVNVDLKITETENADGIPVFISTIERLEVYGSIDAREKEPEYYPSWKIIADSKIAEIDELKKDLIADEKLRIENENTRIQAETSRDQAESERVNKETSRILNENERLKNEAIRVSQEEERVSSEEIRKSKEETRIKNENDRIKQEEEREQYFTDIKEKVDNGEFNGECNFATFDIENGYLVMNKTKDNMLLDFQLNGNDLEVVING